MKWKQHTKSRWLIKDFVPLAIVLFIILSFQDYLQRLIGSIPTIILDLVIIPVTNNFLTRLLDRLFPEPSIMSPEAIKELARQGAIAKQKLEDDARRREAWKQRILTAYDAYIDSLASMECDTSGVYPSGYCINEYGWPNIRHRQEAEAFLNKESFYGDWKKYVQRWNGYIASYKTRDRKEVDNKFRQKIIDELSSSGLPQKRDESVINKNYADYERYATRIRECWDKGDGWSYSVARARQMGYADGPDDKVEKLIGIIENLIEGRLKQEYKEALKKLEEDLRIQNQAKREKWNDLLKGRNDFLAKLKQLCEDIDAERVSNGVK